MKLYIMTSHLKGHADAEQLPGGPGGTKSDVCSGRVMYCRISQHGVVLNLRLAQRGAVDSNENQLDYKKIKLADEQKSAKRTFSAFGSSPKQDDGNLEGLTFAIAHLLGGRFVA
jgi:hypothetical protein